MPPVDARWPILFIAEDNTFFHVATNDPEHIQHVLSDIQRWIGRGRSSPARLADWLTAVDVFDRDRRRLRLVADDAGVSVLPAQDPEPEREDVLLRRLRTAVAPLKKASATIPEDAAQNLPLTVRGYGTYLTRVSWELENAPGQHASLAGAEQVPVAVQVAVQPAGADLPLVGNPKPLPHPRGWFHNLMHQAWG